jgi:predicted MFS family arabinose efflux permease
MLAVGAGLGGVVAAAFGRDAAIIADAASFGISAALIASIGGRFREAPMPEHRVTILEDIRETARYARRDRRVLALLAVKGGFGIGAGVIALLGVFAVQVFHQGDASIGALMSARGAGAFLGPFLFRRFARGGESSLFTGISVSFAMFGACYALFAGAPNIVLAAVAVLGAHMGGGGQWVLSSYALQRLVPDAIRGRVFAFDYGFVTLSISTSLALVGYAAGHASPRVVALVAAGVAVVWAASWTAWTRRMVE